MAKFNVLNYKCLLSEISEFTFVPSILEPLDDDSNDSNDDDDDTVIPKPSFTGLSMPSFDSFISIQEKECTESEEISIAEKENNQRHVKPALESSMKKNFVISKLQHLKLICEKRKIRKIHQKKNEKKFDEHVRSLHSALMNSKLFNNLAKGNPHHENRIAIVSDPLPNINLRYSSRDKSNQMRSSCSSPSVDSSISSPSTPMSFSSLNSDTSCSSQSSLNSTPSSILSKFERRIFSREKSESSMKNLMKELGKYQPYIHKPKKKAEKQKPEVVIDNNNEVVVTQVENLESQVENVPTVEFNHETGGGNEQEFDHNEMVAELHNLFSQYNENQIANDLDDFDFSDFFSQL